MFLLPNVGHFNYAVQRNIYIFSLHRGHSRKKQKYKAEVYDNLQNILSSVLDCQTTLAREYHYRVKLLRKTIIKLLYRATSSHCGPILNTYEKNGSAVCFWNMAHVLFLKFQFYF